MNEPQAVIAFDREERTQIQGALRSYMQEHTIGAPTLQVRIIEADTPRHREIPLSTLQRFIAGSHRTTDAYVALCAQFLKSAGHQFADDNEVFGQALSGFLQPPSDKDTASSPFLEKLRNALPGIHGGGIRTDADQLLNFDLAISAVADQPYMRVQETKMLPGDGAPRYRFEGAVVCSGLLVFVTLRCVLTRLPKLYWLEQLETAEGAPEIYLSGQMSETLFREGAPDGGCVINAPITFASKRPDHVSD